MQRFFKIFIFGIIIMMFLSITVFSAEIDMNLVSDEGNESASNSTVNVTTESELPGGDLASTSSGDIEGSAAPSGVSSIAQENMSFSNILNILVITVGVIIILLAIAILIRLK